ncbi:MAG: hypothetical protein ACO3ND_07745 [Opitutales bacterium]
MSLRAPLAAFLCLATTIHAQETQEAANVVVVSSPPQKIAPPAPPAQIRLRTTVSHPDKNGKTDVLATPSVTAISGTEARVQIQANGGKPGPDGKPAENALEMTATPTYNPATNEITVSMRVVLNSAKPPADEKEAKKEAKIAAKGGAAAVRRDGIPTFYSALPKEKIFSLGDASGMRRWVPIGRAINGWKLESYDPATQVLVITQGDARHELSLNKSLISATATEVNTTVTLSPGQTARVGGMGGVEVSVSADLVR